MTDVVQVRCEKHPDSETAANLPSLELGCVPGGMHGTSWRLGAVGHTTPSWVSTQLPRVHVLHFVVYTASLASAQISLVSRKIGAPRRLRGLVD